MRARRMELAVQLPVDQPLTGDLGPVEEALRGIAAQDTAGRAPMTLCGDFPRDLVMCSTRQMIDRRTFGPLQKRRY